MEIKAYKQTELARKEWVTPRTILNKKDNLVKVVFTCWKKNQLRYLDFEISKIIKESTWIAYSSDT